MRRIPVRNIIVPLTAAAVLLAGCGHKAGSGGGDQAAGKPGGSEAVPVDVATVSLGNISQTIPVTGSLAALQDIQLSVKQTGRVTNVTVREGDAVRAGQVIIQQDTSDLEANVRQAQATLASDEVKVSQAITAYQIQVTQAKQNVINAQAALDQYRQAYLKTKRGNRPQEILQSESSVLQAKANLDNAKITLDRNKSLYAQGAVAKSDLDTAQTTYDVDVAQYQNAQQAYSLEKEGSRQEDIAAAYNQVQQQETNLKNQIANLKDVSSKRDDILAAQATVVQAKAAVSYDQIQVQNSTIVSPINGIVAARTVDPGQVVGPGTNLLRIVNIASVYYQPTIPETELQQTGVGKSVDVQVDAFPGRTFAGKVVAIYPAANTSNRNFSLRVNVPNPDNSLRPGMFARGQVVTQAANGVPVVPATALVPDSNDSGFVPNSSSNEPITFGTLTPPSHVMLIDSHNYARERHVKVGITTMDKVQIVSGLQAGDRIVTTGQQTLKDGDKVAIQNEGSKAPNSPMTQARN